MSQEEQLKALLSIYKILLRSIQVEMVIYSQEMQRGYTKIIPDPYEKADIK